MDYTSISKSNYTSAPDIKAEQIISDIVAEYHLLDYICINGPNYISVIGALNLNILVRTDRFIRTICPSGIILFNYQNIAVKTKWFIKTIKVEAYQPHLGNINGMIHAFKTSRFNIDIIVKKEKFTRINISHVNLLYNTDIDIKAERFIRTFHSSYIYLIKSINREAPSGDHQLTLKSHRGASSMNTSEEHIIYVQDIMVKQEDLDIQTSRIYLTIFSVFISKYFIFNESIIDNYFHIIFSALHQWESLDITHPCPSRSGSSRSHHIEWRDVFTSIIDSNPFTHYLIKWDEINHYIIKNTCIMDIIHQKSVCIIYNLYLKVVQDYIVINDIKENQSSYSITQDISLVDAIIYTIIYHTSIYDSFGTIMVDGIDLSSVTRGYSIIGFIDFTKHPSENIGIILNNHILKKKDLNIRVDTSTSHIFEFIITALNINLTQQFSSIIQGVNDYLIQTDINNTYLPSIHFSDISSQNINMVSIIDYFIITEFDISLQVQDFIYNQLAHPGNQLQLGIIQYDSIILNIHHNIDFHIEHLIHHLESYITFHLWIYLTFDITLDINYINQFSFEPYSTIIETDVIRNANSKKTTYVDIKIPEPYITTGDTDISVYLSISLVELIDSIMEIRTIIVAGDGADIKIIKE